MNVNQPGKRRGVLVDDPRYWVNLLVAGIVLPIWFAVVLGLAIATWAIAPWSSLGKLGVWTAVNLGIICGSCLALTAWYPAWYRPVDGVAIRLVGVVIAVSFLVTLNSLIASAQKTEQARRLAIRIGVVIGSGAVGLTVAQAFLDGWLQTLGEVVSCLVIVGGILLAQKAEARLRSNSSAANSPGSGVTG
jgi:hypothetical protein